MRRRPLWRQARPGPTDDVIADLGFPNESSESVMNFLDDILLSTRESVRAKKLSQPLSDLKRRIRDLEPPRGFLKAIRLKRTPPKPERIRLIAEIKQASPSQGLLRRDFKPAEIARIYEEEGASAPSVLTE